MSRQEKEKETEEKRAQLSSSPRFREPYSRQDTPSPPDDEQRKRPLWGLDFLLSLFPQSRQEKKKGMQEKHSQFSYSQRIREAHPRQVCPSPPDNEQRKRPLRDLDFLLSPFPQSRQEKEKETLEKRSQFSSSQQIKEAHPCQDHPSPPADEQRNRPLRGLDFLLSPFLVSRQEKKKETQEKRSQLLSSQRFREAHPRQGCHSPPDNEQRNRPLRGLDFLLSPFPQSRQEKEKETEEKYLQFSSSQQIKEAHPRQGHHSPRLIEGHSYQIFQSPTVRDTRFRSVFQSQRLRVDHTRQDFQSPSPTKVKTRRKSQSPTMKDHNPRCISIPSDKKESYPRRKCNFLDPIEAYPRCKIYTHGPKEDLMRCI